MNRIEVDIINPKADKLLRDLADMDLISIRDIADDGFSKLVKKIRSRAQINPPTMDDITREVEIVRAKRYAKAKK